MRILYVTTISLTMNSFFLPHIEMLVGEGHHVDIACNINGLPLNQHYAELGCNLYQIDFSRSPFSMDNVKAYGQLKKVVEDGSYDIVHCHTPNAAVITRLVCRKFRKKNGLKVFYTAHGFHFYKGAPKLNWMVFYPIERLCSRFTDKLICINQEDYALAKNRFYAKEVCYVPGVGIDLSRFEDIHVDRAEKRREIGVPMDAFMMLSVGELNENKNHQLIVRAMAKLNNKNIHYVICGVGDKHDCLLDLARELGVSEQLHLLGYRKDVPELNQTADLFCFPSIREGLSVSVMEAMACGLPVVCSRIRGNTDLIDTCGGAHFDSHNVEEALAAVESMLDRDRAEMAAYNRKKISDFSVQRILVLMNQIYEKG